MRLEIFLSFLRVAMGKACLWEDEVDVLYSVDRTIRGGHRFAYRLEFC
jgi:hypothetical protein